MKRLVVLGLALAIIATACSSATVESADVPAAAHDDSRASTLVSCSDTAIGDGPRGEPSEQVEPGPREDVPSALENRNDDSFPEPLVDLDAIRSGGPAPDGIPPIDSPHFATVAEIEFLDDCEPVLALELGGEWRAYPIQIMHWHEIVNDTVGDIPVTVSYCPLCNSAVAFDRRVGERIVDFGTSGSLYQSALVMYDRQTESLWSHFSGEAIVGSLTGTSLERFPVATVSFADFRDAHPEASVLTRETGARRNYGANPYEQYDRADTQPFLFNGSVRDDLEIKTRVIGIGAAGTSIAVVLDDAYARGVTVVDFDGRELVLLVLPGTASALDTGRVSEGADTGATGLFLAEVDGRALTFERADDGFVDNETGSTWNIFGEAVAGELATRQLEAVEHVDTFWFSWQAFNPETTVQR